MLRCTSIKNPLRDAQNSVQRGAWFGAGSQYLGAGGCFFLLSVDLEMTYLFLTKHECLSSNFSSRSFGRDFVVSKNGVKVPSWMLEPMICRDTCEF